MTARSAVVGAPWSALDEVLFDARDWFALDADNKRVPGVVVTSLGAGLALVGQGRVASIVGCLRAEVVAVDVDLPGHAGYAVMDAVTRWATDRGLWHVSRESGGAAGRGHVFLAAGRCRGELEAFLSDWRKSLGASTSTIDLRDWVRPLSAPHRTGVMHRPFGDPARLLDELTNHPWARAGAPASRHRRGSSRQKAGTGKRTRSRSRLTGVQRGTLDADVPLVPTARRRRALDDQWATYLATGRKPLWDKARDESVDSSNSTYELMATAAMVRAGYTVDDARDAIAAAHPEAMSHARRDPAWWVRWQWNKTVEADTAWRAQADPTKRTTPRNEPSAEARVAVEQARMRLRSLAWSTSTRERPALLTIGHTVLDRIERTGSLRVPVPQRDIVLDTGITDRKTIAKHLRALDRVVGTLHTDCFDPVGAPDSSSYEFSIASVDLRGVTEIPPPRFYLTPLARKVPEGSPRITYTVLRALSLDAPLDLEALAHAAQVTHSPETPLTTSQRRTLVNALRALAAAGYAQCLPDGTWLRLLTPNATARTESERAHAVRCEAVSAERNHYRRTMARAAPRRASTRPARSPGARPGSPPRGEWRRRPAASLRHGSAASTHVRGRVQPLLRGAAQQPAQVAGPARTG